MEGELVLPRPKGGDFKPPYGVGGTTADYITGPKQIPFSSKRRKGNGKTLSIKGATGNNLKKCVG